MLSQIFLQNHWVKSETSLQKVIQQHPIFKCLKSSNLTIALEVSGLVLRPGKLGLLCFVFFSSEDPLAQCLPVRISCPLEWDAGIQLLQDRFHSRQTTYYSIDFIPDKLNHKGTLNQKDHSCLLRLSFCET